MNFIERWYLKLKVNQWKEAMMLSGWKTYIVGACSILYGVAGFVLGKHDYDTMMQLVILGLGMMGLKSAIKKASSSFKELEVSNKK